MTPPTHAALAVADTSAAITAFIGYFLVSGSAGIFGYYALRNLRLNRLESQAAFWRYLTLAGVTGVGYGGFGVAELFAGNLWVLAFRDAALLFFVVFVAFAMREIYYNSALAPPADERTFSLRAVRRLEVGFMVVIGIEWLAVLVVGSGQLITVVKALGGIAFALYGLAFGERLETVARGTSLDTLRRHLIPVLICAGFVGLMDVLVLVGVGAVVATATKNVFLVMIAAFTVTATIRLQQNVEGLTVAG
jgi:hypothetical protein